MSELAVGTVLTASRTYTTAMVEAFADLSEDRGRHHIAPDASGRLIVHGLLVASLATELGGRLDYLARTLDFEFLRAVYTGDTVTCSVRIDEAVADARGTRLRLSGEASTADGQVVMRVRSSGLVRARPASPR